MPSISIVHCLVDFLGFSPNHKWEWTYTGDVASTSSVGLSDEGLVCSANMPGALFTPAPQPFTPIPQGEQIDSVIGVANVPSNSSWMLLAVESEAAQSRDALRLTDPSGTTILGSEFQNRVNVKFVDDLSSDTVTYVAVRNPEEGTWLFSLDVATEYFASIDTPLPQATIPEISNQFGDSPFGFSVDASDLPEGSVMTIYVDTDPHDFDGEFAAGPFELGGGVETIEWNPVDLDDGEYFIHYDVFSAKSGLQRSYFEGSITQDSERPLVITLDDHTSTTEDNMIEFDPFANDVGYEATKASIEIVERSLGMISHGDIGGTISYTPLPDFFGTDRIVYRVRDDGGLVSQLASVTIEVNPVNDAPVAEDDSVTVLGRQTYEVTVVANDTDVDGVVDRTTVEIAGTPENGSAIVDAQTGTVSFSPTAGFLGLASFDYRVADSDGLLSNVAHVDLRILPTSQWTNPADRYDVDDSDNVSPGDALTIINVIADGGFRDLPSERPEDTYFLDVTNDNRLTPADALAVIDFIAARQAARTELISSDFLPERPESASDESPDAIVDEDVLFAGRQVVKNSGDGRFVNAVSLPEIHSGLDLALKDVVDDALSGLLDQDATLAVDIRAVVGD